MRGTCSLASIQNPGYAAIIPIIATPTVPSATPSLGLYATPTVTATSSPTDPTTAGAPFPLAPIVAPVVAIIISLLLAAVLVIVLVLGCKYGGSECSV